MFGRRRKAFRNKWGICGSRSRLTSVLSNSCASFSPSGGAPSFPLTALAFSAWTTLNGIRRSAKIVFFFTHSMVVLRGATAITGVLFIVKQGKSIHSIKDRAAKQSKHGPKCNLSKAGRWVCLPVSFAGKRCGQFSVEPPWPRLQQHIYKTTS